MIWNKLFGRRASARHDFATSVQGVVVDIRRAEYKEDKCAGFDAEQIVVACEKSGATVACMRFSDEQEYGSVEKGQKVEMRYARVLDETDFGTALKVRSVRVLAY